MPWIFLSVEKSVYGLVLRSARLMGVSASLAKPHVLIHVRHLLWVAVTKIFLEAFHCLLPLTPSAHSLSLPLWPL
jgi:hypothetical protein